MSPADQSELLKRCRRNELPAWDDLIVALSPEVGRFVSLLSPRFTPADIEAVTASTFVEAITTLPHFGGRSPATTGLLHTAMRQARAHRIGSVEEPSQNAAGGNSMTRQDAGVTAHFDLMRALDRLAGPCRDLIELRHFGNLTVEDLAPEFDISEDALRIRLRKCLETLGGVVSLKSADRPRPVFAHDDGAALSDRMVAALAAYAEWRCAQFPNGFDIVAKAQAQVRTALSRLPLSAERETSPRRRRIANPEFWSRAIGATVGVLTVAAGVVLVANRGARVAGSSPETGVGDGARKPQTGVADSLPGSDSKSGGTQQELDEFLGRISAAKAAAATAPERKADLSLAAPEEPAASPPRFFTESPAEHQASAALQSGRAGETTPAPEATTPVAEAGPVSVASDSKSVPPWIGEVKSQPGDGDAGMSTLAEAAIQLRSFAHLGAKPLLAPSPDSVPVAAQSQEANATAAAESPSPASADEAGAVSPVVASAPEFPRDNDEDGASLAAIEVSRDPADDNVPKGDAANRPSHLTEPAVQNEVAGVAGASVETPGGATEEVSSATPDSLVASASNGPQASSDSAAPGSLETTPATSTSDAPTAPREAVRSGRLPNEVGLAEAKVPTSSRRCREPDRGLGSRGTGDPRPAIALSGQSQFPFPCWRSFSHSDAR